MEGKANGVVMGKYRVFKECLIIQSTFLFYKYV